MAFHHITINTYAAIEEKREIITQLLVHVLSILPRSKIPEVVVAISQGDLRHR